MAQLNKIRFADGRVERPGDWTVSPLYSTVDIATGTLATLDAFSYGKGGEIPGSVATAGSTNLRIATLKDTNMEGQGGILAENEELLIFGLVIELIQRAPTVASFFTNQETWAPDPPLVSFTNCLRVQQDTLVKMRIANTKEYLSVPLGWLPAARGVYHVLGSARSEGTSYAEGVVIGNNGGVNEGTHRIFATPHEVLPGEAFVIQFEFPRGSVQNLDFGDDSDARISCRVFTRGLRRRPVA